MVSRKSPRPSAPVPPPPVEAVLAIADNRQLERIVLDKLQSHPGLHVCSLVVHRCHNGLCLEGHVELIDPVVDVAGLLAEIDTTTPILNRVMVSAPMVGVP